MGLASSSNSSSDLKRPSKAWSLMVVGYSAAAAGLVAFLTINGGSGTPPAVTISMAALIIVGLFLPAAGMLQSRRSLGTVESAARHGYAMQAVGLMGLLFGVVLVVEVASLPGLFISAVFVVASGVSAIAGAVLLRGHYIGATTSNARSVLFLVVGTVLIFSGVGVVVGSNIAYEYLISQVENTVYVDMGATISACGCVLAAYSFFEFHNHLPVSGAILQ